MEVTMYRVGGMYLLKGYMAQRKKSGVQSHKTFPTVREDHLIIISINIAVNFVLAISNFKFRLDTNSIKALNFGLINLINNF